jgi:hypothetical protein
MATILVTGDVTIDSLQWDIKRSNNDLDDNQNLQSYNGYEIVERKGGALLLARMVDAIKNEKNILLKQKDNELNKNPEKFIHSMCVLEKFTPSIKEDLCKNTLKELENMVPAKEDENDVHKVYLEIINKLRIYEQDNGKKNLVKTFYGFKLPEDYNPRKNLPVPPLFHDTGRPNIVLIHDGGFYFRHNKEYWTNSVKKDYGALYIHKMDRPLANGVLWNFLEKKKNLIVIIRANDLREKGLRITKSLSWERTAYDFLNEMEKIRKKDEDKIENHDLQKIKQLSKCSNLIVRFGVDGAILYQNKGETADYTLLFDPEVSEGGLEQKYAGYYMKGLRSAFISGLILDIQNNTEGFEKILVDGIRKGILVSRNLLNIGFLPRNNNGNMDYPLKHILSNMEDNKIQDVKIQDEKSWKIIKMKLDGEEKIYDAACKFVKYGENSILKAPVVKFGKLRTADRSEIESFHSIKNLITEYLNKKTKVPLSIAVFGPPGAGKSFGVTELAKTISDKIEKVEFNISQFESPKDLFSAFHMIQSTSLEGKIPLVFFDEFDCNLDGEEYGWLRYFLSPMNDGTFKQGDTIHPIGQCIFVFAGGTKSTFAEFEVHKKLKGSDFGSRLRGYVNIMGLNQFNDDTESDGDKEQRRLYEECKWQKNYEKSSDQNDYTYMIRRAVALRTILEKNAENIFAEVDGIKIANIDDFVLNAFIRVPEYKHGVRSMEAIVEMSILSNYRKKFERSALPSSEQLELHVDTKEFKKCLNDSECKDPISLQIEKRMKKAEKATGDIAFKMVEKMMIDLNKEGIDSKLYLEVIPLLERLFKDSISSNKIAQVYRWMGEIYDKNEEKDLAVKNFEKALKYNPKIGVRRTLNRLRKIK